MTSKDYKLLAEVIKRNVQTASNNFSLDQASTMKYTMKHLVLDLASELLSKNPRFNTDKFYLACGLPELAD